MEGMLTFAGIVVIVFGILQIILFFKIWGMTNDIHDIKIFLLKGNEHNSQTVNSESNKYVVDLSKEKNGNNYTGKFNKNEHVIRKADGFEMKISSIKNGLYKCFSGDGTMLYQGEYEEDELLKK